VHHAVAAATDAASRVLAAALRLTLAQLLAEAGDPGGAALEAEAALQGLPMTADRELRAHLQVARGMARQQMAPEQPGLLQAVVQDLTEAARVFREETHPELFALCNQHLALAYLVMPMSDRGDRLRLGIAVNALRAALRVYTPRDHPAEWASTQVNLANALQYLPSSHPQENLDEAVQLYEEVLQHRDPRADPVGYARILSNQGNALGHLGAFEDARERLTRARDMFAHAGDTDGARTVTGLLDGLEAAAAGRSG
jgi:tetratricopeptide (TPR) repeat protein